MFVSIRNYGRIGWHVARPPIRSSACKENSILRIGRASDFCSLVDRRMMGISKLSLSLAISSAIFRLSQAQFCIESIDEIYTSESQVTDTSQRRKYVLCPRRIFDVGTLNHNFELQGLNVNPPLPIRPNITIQCGDTGSRENMCWMTQGDLHMDATPFRGIADTTVEGVELTGLVFIGANKYSIWATKPGDITFTDCEWREHTKSVVPIMLDWFDGSSSQLSVTFDGCDFFENQYFGRGSYTSLIYANGQQNSLNFVASTFENNDMMHNNTLAGTSSFLIESLGPVTIRNTCFTNNMIGVSNLAVFGSSFANTDNFEQNSTGSLCQFASVFETLEQFDNFLPLCVSAGATSCLSDQTSAPSTIAPTASGAPSGTPTSPTASPTNSSAPSISPAPTFLGQTPEPTVAPTPEQTVPATPSQPPVAPESSSRTGVATDVKLALVTSTFTGVTCTLFLYL